MIGFKYCSKCGKVIELEYYPFNRTIAEELMVLENEHSIHLCDTCVYSYPDCNAQKVTFGNCVGNDNIVECDAYKEKGSRR